MEQPHETPADDPDSRTIDRPVTRRTALCMAGAAGVGTLALGATAGSAAASEPCEDCVPFGKVKGQPAVGDRYELSAGDYTVVIEVEEVGSEDGEVVRLKWKMIDTPDSDYRAVCRVDFKGGPQVRSRTFVDEDDRTDAYSAYANAPAMHDRNPNRSQYAISYVRFWICVPEGAVETTDDDGRPSRGRGRGRVRGRGNGRGRGKGRGRS